MPYVKVKTKGQVTIPAEFWRDLNLKEGDLLEPLVERGGILLKPKTVVDRYDEEWAKRLLKKAEEEYERHSKTPEEEDAEERRLLALGAAQANKLGIKPQDAEKIVHDYRKNKRQGLELFSTPTSISLFPPALRAILEQFGNMHSKEPTLFSYLRQSSPNSPMCSGRNSCGPKMT